MESDASFSSLECVECCVVGRQQGVGTMRRKEANMDLVDYAKPQALIVKVDLELVEKDRLHSGTLLAHFRVELADDYSPGLGVHQPSFSEAKVGWMLLPAPKPTLLM